MLLYGVHDGVHEKFVGLMHLLSLDDRIDALGRIVIILQHPVAVSRSTVAQSTGTENGLVR